VIGIRDKYHKKDQIQFINILDKKRQQEMSPIEVLDLLKSGNHRFLQGKHSEKNYMLQANATASGQNPMAIIVGCIDSRTSPEIIFDASLGDILTIRVAGNIVSPEIIGSIELAIDKFGVKLIVVKGHSSCGAVATSLYHEHQKNVNFVTKRIYRAVEQSGFSQLKPEEVDPGKMEVIARRNTENSIIDIMNESPFLKEKIENNEVGIVSAYHDLSSGQVHFGDIR
jgi:carbonic anhydrase